jgi:hypothetical protein
MLLIDAIMKRGRFVIFIIANYLLNFYSTLYGQTNIVLNGEMDDLILFNKLIYDNEIDSFYYVLDTFCFKHNLEIGEHRVGIKYWDDSTLRIGRYSEVVGKAYSGCCYRKITTLSIISDNAYSISNAKGMLSKELLRDEEYEISFMIRHDKKDLNFNKIEVLLSDTNLELSPIVENFYNYNKVLPSFEFDSYIPNTFEKFKFQYKAKGGEKYIYIGNLSNEIPKSYLKKDKILKRGIVSYAIDNVVVTEVSGYPKIAIKQSYSDYFDTILVYRHFYDLNSSEIDSLKIDSIINIDSCNNFLAIGHTDITGDSTYNKLLSIERASTFSKKLSKYFDIPFYGEGSKNPISNTNQYMNRRVDLFCIKKIEHK